MTDDELEAQIRAKVALCGWVVSTNKGWPRANPAGLVWLDVIDPNARVGTPIKVLGGLLCNNRRLALDEAAKFLKELE